MNLIKNRNKNQRGFVSLEIMVGLAVVAVIVAASLVLINKVINDNRGKTEIENISLLSQKTQELFAQDSSYEGLTAEVLIKAGALKPEMIKGTTLVNSWKEPLTIAAASSGSAGAGAAGNKDAYEIVTNGVPDTQCVKIANAFRKQAINLKVNNAAVVTAGGESTSVAAIAGNCKSANNKNTITITLR